MEKNKKICKHCKEEIAKGAKKCPKCGGNQGLPGFVKALIIIVIVIVCIVGCMNSCAKGVDEAVKETSNEWNDINGKTTFKVNETFENKYEKITMTEVNINFTDYGEYSEPKEGHKYAMAKFEVENINDGDELYVSSLDFNADADGVSVDSGYIGNDKYKDLSATLAKGKKSIGYVFYEVPKDAKKITITYNPNFWVDGNAIEFIVQE
ncbi:MAG: DUF4352 domain-containing protein [Bacilli bacterium]|nr:DUF4352 domain-containing protein [Bacilli bacterium]